MSIDQLIDKELSAQARRAWSATRERTREWLATVEAYKRAFETTREFRRSAS